MAKLELRVGDKFIVPTGQSTSTLIGELPEGTVLEVIGVADRISLRVITSGQWPEELKLHRNTPPEVGVVIYWKEGTLKLKLNRQLERVRPEQ